MSQATGERLKHYGTFGLRRIARQIASTRRSQQWLPEYVKTRIERLRVDQSRIAEALGRPIEGLRILNVGPGQLLREARFFGEHNQVTCLDIDVIPKGVDVFGYAAMVRNNGAGRFLKTVGRKLLGRDHAELEEWKRQLGTSYIADPPCLIGDICDGAPYAGTWDVVATWSVFQHIPDVPTALRRCVEALRPGGVLYVSIQLWTSNTGHHDIRAYIGEEDKLPLWAHLRPGHEHQVQSSAWLNQRRLRDWRTAFAVACPGYSEFLEQWDAPYKKKMTPELREELSDYDDEELYTVDVVYRWRKPHP